MATRSCVVTGAAGGIGAAVVDRLLTDGWAVVGCDLRSDDAHPTTDRYGFVPGDVADPATHAAAADRAAAFGELTGWVNCAGYNILGAITELSEADLRRGVEVDLLGYFHGTAEACRRFLVPPRPRSAALVHIGSIQGSVGFPGFAAYAMCKAGIEGLSRQVAAEYAGRGIRSNVVAPGVITSPINDQLAAGPPQAATVHKALDELSPLGRWGEPAEVAHAVAFLLDPERAGYVTGEVLGVNGGALALARGQRSPADDQSG